MSLSPELAAARSAGEALTRAGHPWGPLIIDWVEEGGRRSLDEALGLSAPTVARDGALARRDALLRSFFALFADRPKHEQVGAAYSVWETYWNRKWETRKHIAHGGHEEGSQHRLCWEIFSAYPRLIRRRQFQNVVRAK